MATVILGCFRAVHAVVGAESLRLQFIQPKIDGCVSLKRARSVIIKTSTGYLTFEAEFALEDAVELLCYNIVQRKRSCEQIFAQLAQEAIFGVVVLLRDSGAIEVSLPRGRVIVYQRDSPFSRYNSAFSWQLVIIIIAILLVVAVFIGFCVDSLQSGQPKARSTFRYGIKGKLVDNTYDAEALRDAIFEQSRYYTMNRRLAHACIGKDYKQQVQEATTQNESEINRFIRQHHLDSASKMVFASAQDGNKE